MFILSDIIIDCGYTEDDIIISNLTHYTNLNPDAIIPSTIFLNTCANIVPYITLFDKSDEKKDATTSYLKSYCENLNSDIAIPPNNNKVELLTLAKISKLKTIIDSTLNNLKLSCESKIAMYSYVAPRTYEKIIFNTTISENIHNKIFLSPIGCKLTKLDNAHLYELGSFSLCELDFYEEGTRLALSQVDLDVSS